MNAQRTIYYVTDRKGSSDEPLDETGNKTAAFNGRQKFYGPFRNE